MLRTEWLRKGLIALLAIALFGVTNMGSAYAASGNEKLAELQQQVDGLESLVKDLSISVMQASKSLEAQATGLQPRIFNVENMVKDLSFDVKKTVSALSNMQGNVDALGAQVEEFQPLVITLQSTVVQFGNKLDGIGTSISMLTVAQANLGDRADQTDARIAALDDHLSGQIANLSDGLAALDSALSAAKASVDTNTQLVAGLSDAVNTLNVKVESNSGVAYKNSDAIDALGTTVDALSATLIQLRSDVEDAVGQLSNAGGTLDERVSKLERAVDELNILGPTLASLRNTVAGLAARSDRVDARLGRLEDVTGQFSASGAILDKVMVKTQALQARLSDAEQMIKELKAQPAPSSDAGVSASMIVNLQAQIDQIKAALAGVGTGQDNGDLKGKIGQLVVELETLKNDVSSIRDQVSSTTTIDKEQIISEIRTEIKTQVTDLSDAARKADEAAKKADAANGLALLALLAGVGAIALNLLL